MELKSFTQELMMRMESEIQSIELDQTDALVRTSQTIVCVESYISELKGFIINYAFKDIDEEIDFFKHIKPALVSKLLFLRKLFKLQIVTSFNSSSAVQKQFDRKLSKLESFVNSHQEFYRYIHSNATHLDKFYFTRKENVRIDPQSDERFSTTHDSMYCRILAAERLRHYLQETLSKTELNSVHTHSPITWTGSKTDLIELIYALHAAEVFNKGNVDVKQIATLLESVLNVALGNYYRVFQEIRIRKTGQVNFINQLKDALIKRIQQGDV